MGEGTVPVPLKMILLLLLLPTSLLAAEAEASPGGEPASASALRPTRASLYQHLASELEAVAGAEEHVRAAYLVLQQGVDEAVVRGGVVVRLQALVDGVVEAAEDAWVAADEARRTLLVKPCVDHAETDAQQVVKKALEKMRGCVEGLEAEGQRRAREAARLVDEIETLSKRFVTELELCVKEEAEREANPEPAAPAPAPAVPDPAPEPVPTGCTDLEPPPPAGSCPMQEAEDAAKEGKAEGKSKCPVTGTKGTACPAQQAAEAARKQDKTQKNVKEEGGKCGRKRKEDKPVSKESAQEAEVAEDTRKDKNREKENKKYKKDASKKVEKDVAEGEEVQEGPEGISAKKDEKKKLKEEGKKGGKEGKDKQGKGKKDQGGEEVGEENSSKVEGKGKKEGKGKDKREGKKEGKEEGKKGKEGKEEGKGRKKRDLSAVEEEVVVVAEAVLEPASEPASASALSDPEERRVTACLASPVLAATMAEKTRAYQRLQAVLQRVAAKEAELRQSTCVVDIEHKAAMKAHAITERMRSCVDRKMRSDEL